jgi:hypothetical protein
MKRKLKTKELLNNSYQFLIGMFWLMPLGLAQFFKVKGTTFDRLKSKVEYRINKMN